MTYASDWPAAVPDANPWTGLAGMISRQNFSGSYAGTVGADEAISLEEAPPLFTRNGAHALGMENETETLEAGKRADFIVLDESLETMTAEKIANVQVRATIWKGQKVYEREA